MSVLVVACGARTDLGVSSPTDATIDVADEASHPDGGEQDAIAPLLCPVAPFDTPVLPASCPPTCGETAGAKTGAINLSAPSCDVDALVHEGDEVELDFPCYYPPYYGAPDDFDAGGMLALAELNKGSVKFFGNLTNTGVFSACASTTFVGSDGCTWSTAQTITGPVPAHCGGKVGPFTFSYDEKPIQGTSCKPACTATATLTSP